MKIAVEGCCHGELDRIYDAILEEERISQQPVDLVLLCGDIQALRNEGDLASLAVPTKYQRLGDFHKYYAGEKVAPILTLVIGGNHEASNYMWELFYGGWIAPNIYYMGAAGCVEVNGIPIAAASGIFKNDDYQRGRFERQPFSAGDMRSIYHTRQFEITKLAMLSRPTVFMSHDWPNGVEQYGDVQALLRAKPFFREEVYSSSLGSPPLQMLLNELQPRYWFSAHLHVEFAAHVVHGVMPQASHASISDNPEAINVDDDSDEELPPTPSVVQPQSITDFLALGKCTSKGGYLHVRTERNSFQFFEIPTSTDTLTQGRREVSLTYHKPWLAITQALDPYFSFHRTQKPLPLPTDPNLQNAVHEAMQKIDAQLATAEGNPLDIRIAQPFTRTAPTQSEYAQQSRKSIRTFLCKNLLTLDPYKNPQTEAFCQLAGIPNRINSFVTKQSTRPNSMSSSAQCVATPAAETQNEIRLIHAVGSQLKRKRD